MKTMVLSSVVQGNSGFGRGLLLTMGLGLAVLVFVAPVFGGFGVSSSGVGGLALFCSFSMALRRILKTACIRDSENRSLTAISVISFTNEVDRILLGVLDAVVRILGFELSLEGSKRILQIAHQ